jgi:hypothetical protein
MLRIAIIASINVIGICRTSFQFHNLVQRLPVSRHRVNKAIAAVSENQTDGARENKRFGSIEYYSWEWVS